MIATCLGVVTVFLEPCSTGGKVDLSAMPMRYEIDYVRVYQK
jgi:hypothetical protein